MVAKQMQVLANDGMHQKGVGEFRKRDIMVDLNKRDPANLLKDIAAFDALVVRSATKVTREVIEAGAKDGKLKIVGRAGVGIDNVDLAAATEFGVVVKTAPFGNTNSTAELALALMLAAARNVAQAHRTLAGGEWQKKRFEGVELAGKTLGVIGCGRIGSRLAELAQGIGMQTVGFDPFLTTHAFVRLVTKPELLREADFVSIHTGGKDVMVGAAELELMKSTAYLVNASRNGNVDPMALYDALTAGKLAGAALDVHQNEPKKDGDKFESRFAALPNVVLTSHLGASTREAQEKTSLEMAQRVMSFLLDGNYAGAVNMGKKKEDESQVQTFNVFVTHRDEPGVFAKVDAVFAKYELNIKENTSEPFADGKKAHTTWKLYTEAPAEALAEIRELPFVVNVR